MPSSYSALPTLYRVASIEEGSDDLPCSLVLVEGGSGRVGVGEWEWEDRSGRVGVGGQEWEDGGWEDWRVGVGGWRVGGLEGGMGGWEGVSGRVCEV